ncbi:MAG: hypothetical protein AAF559_10155 [Pseudomonadota bacterium]
MDHGTKSTIRTGIVDKDRYASDPIYRHNVDVHAPMAAPTRLKQFSDEYYAANRAEAAQGLWALIVWIVTVFVPAVFVLGALLFMALGLAFAIDPEAKGIAASSYVGLSIAAIGGLAYAWLARRAQKTGFVGQIGLVGQGAALAACVIMMPVFVFGAHFDAQAGRIDGFEEIAVFAPILVAGLALTLSYRRWLLTCLFTAYTGALVGLGFLIT